MRNYKVIKQVAFLSVLAIVAGGSVILEQEINANRIPASFIPDENKESLPESKNSWMGKILIPDRKGVMKSIQSNIQNWERVEEYNRNWNLDSVGLYKTPDRAARQKYLSKRLLKYLDKRLTGEIKSAKKGSALSGIKKAKNSLRPNTQAQLSKNVKVKIKGRVLQGKAIVKVINPYVNYRANIKLNGQVDMNIKKNIKALNVEVSADYNLNSNIMTTRIDRPMGKLLKARISSSQSANNMPFNKNASKVELLFNKKF